MNDLVPDVVDVVPPSGKLQVSYPEGLIANEGYELTPTQVKDVPTVSWSEGQQEELHTLLMVDPDAPSRAGPKYREILHWAVINIPGNKLELGQTRAEYIGSGPPQGSGLHRYVFLLYRQSKRIDKEFKLITKFTRDGRVFFNTREFAAKHGLGQPIGASFYQAQYDNYVPELDKQLSVVPIPLFSRTVWLFLKRKFSP